MSESKYYNYLVKDSLSKDLDDIKSIDNYIFIHLCVYSVNTEGKTPFLQYLLSNDGYKLALPKLPVYSLFDKDNITSYSKVFLSGILEATNFEEFSNDMSFDGFYEYNDDLYMFFDITKCTINDNNVRFGLIDEIINHRHICNVPIDNNTSLFFIKNEYITYLCDEKKSPYEIPIIGFVGKRTKQKVNFTMTFGEIAKDKSAILGPYFYFTNYQNAIRQGKGGIIRFALFTGYTKYIENAPNDPIDESDIKKFRLEDNTLDHKKEVATLRISDHDGLWTNTYDSVYLGNLELDDGSFLDDTPMIVLQNYNQQLPLSCHNSILGDKHKKYLI